MRKTLFSILLSAAAIHPTFAGEPITLRDMGSFHVGGRVVEISGKPVKEVVFGAGGVPAKVDPNGLYQVEQMWKDLLSQGRIDEAKAWYQVWDAMNDRLNPWGRLPPRHTYKDPPYPFFVNR